MTITKISDIIKTVKEGKTLTSHRASGEKEETMEEMTRLELMTLLLSLEALLEEDKSEKALEVIKKVLAEAERS